MIKVSAFHKFDLFLEVRYPEIEINEAEKYMLTTKDIFSLVYI